MDQRSENNDARTSGLKQACFLAGLPRDRRRAHRRVRLALRLPTSNINSGEGEARAAGVGSAENVVAVGIVTRCRTGYGREGNIGNGDAGRGITSGRSVLIVLLDINSIAAMFLLANSIRSFRFYVSSEQWNVLLGDSAEDNVRIRNIRHSRVGAVGICLDTTAVV